VSIADNTALQKQRDGTAAVDMLLSGSPAYPDLAQRASAALEACLAATNARAGAIVLLSDDAHLDVVAAIGYPAELVELWHRFSLTAHTPLSDTVRTGEPILLPSRGDWAIAYPHMALDPRLLQDEARAAIPLTIAGRVIGALGLSYSAACAFQERDVALLTALARPCALAIEAARPAPPFASDPAESEHVFLALDAAGMGTWDHDLVAGTVYLSERCCALFGRPGPFRGAAVELATWHYPGDLEAGLAVSRQALARDRADFRMEVRAIWPDGSLRWHAVYGRFLRDAAGCAVRAIGMSRDITREKAESERFRMALDVTGLGDWAFDLTQGKAIFSERCCALHGRPGPYEGPLSPIRGWYIDGDLDHASKDMYAALERGEDDFHTEARTLWPDGSIHWLAIYGRFLQDSEGKPTRALGMSRDITQEKEAERQRRDTDARLAAIVLSVTEAILSVDAMHRIVLFNAAAERMFGCSAAEAIGAPLTRFLPERHAEPPDTVSLPLGGGDILKLRLGQMGILWARRHNGIAFPIEVSLSQTALDNGEPLYTAVIRDITDRLAAEHVHREAATALRVSEERYRSLVQASSQIVWTSPGDGSGAPSQPAWAAFTGQDGDRHTRYAAIHPDDRAATSLAWETAARSGVPFESEHRVRRHDGEYRLMQARAIPVRNEDGSIREWIGVHTDVTEQRSAELKQRQFTRDVLFSVTEGRLRLCQTPDDLPAPLAEAQPIGLTTEALSEVRRRVRETAAAAGFPDDRTMGLMSAASECAMNAVTHGGESGEARIVIAPDGATLQVWITDQGRGIDVAELPKATLMKGYSGSGGAGGFGHGFFLMLAHVDTIYLLTGLEGTTVVLEQHKEPPLDMFGF